MLQVKVDQLLLSNMGFVVLLKNEEDERTLPIFIGAAEAQAIAIKVNGVDLPRPLTHDQLKNFMDCLECRLQRVEVCDLKEGTFYARLVLERDGTRTEMDCRPSDAIALALRISAPIFVDEKVMNEAGRVLDKSDTSLQPIKGTETTEEKKTDAPLSPVERLQMELNRAVKEERYEDAAKLRDEIENLKGSHSEN
jgi:bifunctional DNase/RNase